MAIINRKRSCGIFLVSVVILAPACGLIYDDFYNCPVNGGITVVADWQFAPEVPPENMACSFFPLGGSEVWNFHFSGAAGGYADIDYGSYSVLLYNDDTSRIRYKNTSDFSTFTFYCRTGALYDGLGGTVDNPIGPSESSEGEPVEICPDMIWGDTVGYFSFGGDCITVVRGEDGIMKYSSPQVLILYPVPLTASYHYVVERIENLDGMARACCSLSGMASVLQPAGMRRGNKAVTLPLKSIKISDAELGGSFFTFGLPDEPAAPNILTLYVWLSDGQKFSYRFDVSAQIRQAQDPMNVTLRVGGISLPEVAKPAVDGDLDISVDGWTTVIIDIQS